jgi:hypothetical protein
MIDRHGRVIFEDRQFSGNGGAWMTSRFSFSLEGRDV